LWYLRCIRLVHLLLNIYFLDYHVKLREPLADAKLGANIALHQIHSMLLLAVSSFLDFLFNDRQQRRPVACFGRCRLVSAILKHFFIILCFQQFKFAGVNLSDKVSIPIFFVQTLFNHLANVETDMLSSGFTQSFLMILFYETLMKLDLRLASMAFFLNLFLLVKLFESLIIDDEFSMLVCCSLEE
jgi:hypothetical protein